MKSVWTALLVLACACGAPRARHGRGEPTDSASSPPGSSTSSGSRSASSNAARAEAQKIAASDSTQWREVISPHFVLRTNLADGDAEQAARELEHMRAALVSAMFEMEIDPPGRLQAILFRDTSGLNEFVDRRIDGFVTSTPAGPLLVSAGANLRIAGEGRTKLFHELAHYLSSFAFLRQPAWLSEGLSEYAEMLDFPSAGSVRIGVRHDENLRELRRQGVMPLEELFGADDPATAQIAFSYHFYASAWLWLHFFSDRYPRQLEAFKDMLRRAEDPIEAYATAFSNQLPKKLEDQVQQYLIADRYVVRTHPIESPRFSSQVRPMSAADLHAMRAELFLESPVRKTAGEKRTLADREIKEALQSDPHHIDAVILRAESQSAKDRLAAARELVKVWPEEGRAWTFLAGELDGIESQRSARLEALERAAHLGPDDAVALNNLAWEKVNHGDPALGLKLAMRAVQIVPWSPGMLDTYSAALFKVGRCPEARDNEERAVSLLHDEVTADTRQQLLGALMQYRRKCPVSTDRSRE